MEPIEVTPKDVEAALPIVHQVARKTPVLPVSTAEGEVLLKLENLQNLGVFKIRGIWNRLSRLSEAERGRGVSTISSGNHGLSLAWAAKQLGLSCVVHVPEGAAPQKVAAIKAYGAECLPMPRAELVRAHLEETYRDWPSTFIHPFAHAHTVAGAGTAGWEIAEQAPEIRTVLVPVGGGGLASGVAVAVKGLLPHAQVLGVQAEGAASLPEALRTHAPSRVEAPKTVADGIQIGLVLPSMVGLLTRHLDGCLLVNDREILAAMRHLALAAKVVAEPSGAAAFAAWRRHHESLKGPVAVIVSGGNVNSAELADSLGNSEG